MSLVPAWEIGVWNAWIFMVYLLLSIIPFMYIAIKKESPSVKETGLSRLSMMFATSSKLFLLPVMLYSIFLPLKLETAWFYIGLPVTLIGLLGYTMVLLNWATTPLDNQVSHGLYRYSRHPMYLTMFIFLLGLSIITASWLLLLFFLVFVVGCVVYAGVEERSCTDKYGNAYREYLNKTPRWLGIPKPVVKSAERR
ncbi:MAG: methyltransferase [Dehalococcoidia bacterium]|jgi:protein-S-isoprenylcysteine O-methyltransferase Ste14